VVSVTPLTILALTRGGRDQRPYRAARAMQAMLTMRKIDIAALRATYDAE